MVTYRNGDELMMVLRRALEIELSFEHESQWDAYYEKEKLRALLMELIVDSAQHAEMVQSLMAMVKVSPGKTFSPVRGREFNFKNKNELEMMMDLGRTEILMRDLYTDVRDSFSSSPAGLLLDDADAHRFLTTINSLIAAEQHHSELVAKHVGKVERVR